MLFACGLFARALSFLSLFSQFSFLCAESAGLCGLRQGAEEPQEAFGLTPQSGFRGLPVTHWQRQGPWQGSEGLH